MEKQSEHTHGGGFFLGVLIGAAATLIVTTKHGRKLLHALRDEGLGRFGEWENVLQDVASALEDEDFVDGDDYVAREARPDAAPAPEEEPVVRRVPDTSAAVHERSDMPQSDRPSHAVHPHVTHQHHQTPYAPVHTPHTSPSQPAWQPPQVHGEPIRHMQPAIAPEEPTTPEVAEPQPRHTFIPRPRVTSRRFFRGIPRKS